MAEPAGNVFGPINAEPGDTSQFSSVIVYGGNTFAADAAAKNKGVYGFKATYAGTRNGAAGARTFSNQTSLYVRQYFYIDPAMDLNVAYTVNALLTLLQASGSVQLVIFEMTDGGGDKLPERWRVAGQGLTAAMSLVNWSMGAWHYVDIYWIAHASAGGAVVKVDGTQIFSQLNINTSAYVCNLAWIGDAGGVGSTNPDAGQYLYYDDIKADTRGWIGSYADMAGLGQSMRGGFSAMRGKFVK